MKVYLFIIKVYCGGNSLKTFNLQNKKKCKNFWILDYGLAKSRFDSMTSELKRHLSVVN